MDHDCGAHSTVEISYSYCHTTREPLKRFVYELIGTEGVIRYDREARVFEMRTPQKTEQLPFAGEKDFAGMYEAFHQALETGDLGDLPSGRDGVVAATISREATNAVIAARAR